jgi:hypothetical protein
VLSWKSAIGVLWSLLPAGAAAAADCAFYQDHMRPLARLAAGGNGADLLDDDHVVVVGLSELAVLLVSDPQNPGFVGSVPLPTAGEDVAVSGSVAYVAGGSGGVHVVDLSDPEDPSLATSLTAYDEAEGVDVDGDRLAVADGSAGVHVFDISAALSPAWLGTYDTVGLAVGVDLKWPFAHVADVIDYQIVDFTDPANPDQRGVSAPAAQTFDVEVEGTLAATANGEYGAALVDVSDPDQHSTLDNLSQPTAVTDVKWSGGDLLLASRWGLGAVRVSSGTLEWQGGVDSHGDGNALVVDGDLAYLIATLEVTSVGLASRTSPQALGTETLPGFAALDVEVLRDGAHALYACGAGGIQIVTISDRESPAAIGGLNALSFSRHVTLVPDTDVACVADGGVRTVDVSNARAMQDLGFVATPGGGRARLHAVSDRAVDHVYLADGPAGLVIVDVTDPTKPEVVGSADTPGFALDVLKVGNLAYVADEFPGVQIFDVSDPAHPAFVSVIDTPGRATALAEKDGHLLVADGFLQGLLVYAIGGGTIPVAFVPIPEVAVDVVLDGDLAYLPDQRAVHVIDLANAAKPVYLGGSLPSAQPFALAVAADALWTADLLARAVSYPKQCPPTTAIALSGLEARALFWAVEVTWRTSFEQGHEGFRVERSDGGPGAYRTVTRELVRGTSPYSWVDEDVNAGTTYWYRLVAMEWSGAEQVTPPVAVTTPRWPRAAVALENAAPNPFRGRTSIRFTLRRAEEVSLTIHDVAGRLLRTLERGRADAGVHRRSWDGRDERGRQVAAGVYFVRLATPSSARAGRIVRTD